MALPGDDTVKQLLLTAALISAAVFAGPLGGHIAIGFESTSIFGGVLGTTTFWQTAILAGGGLLAHALVKPPVLS